MTLIADLGGGVRVECKALSRDIGRRIRTHDAIRFYSLVKGELRGVLRSLDTGLALILTVPDRLPADHTGKAAIAKKLARQVLSGASGQFGDGCDLRILEFDVQAKRVVDPSGAPDYAMIGELTGVLNEHALVQRNRRGTVVLVLKSAKDDNTKDAILRRMGAAADQLSSQSAGFVVVGLNALSPASLRELAEHDKRERSLATVLRVTASDFLDSAPPHIIGVVWLSGEEFVSRTDGVSLRNAAYWFPRRDGPFWDSAFERVLGGE